MQKILILDFGGQYNRLIERRVRELGVCCALRPHGISTEELLAEAPAGIILTGGPNSVYEEGAPYIGRELLELGIPVLGICYGCQLIARLLGGAVSHAPVKEFGRSTLHIVKEAPMSEGVPSESVCWMSHADSISALPAGFEVLGYTDRCPVAVFGNEEKKLYGVQFHPEVTHSAYGTRFLANFLFNVCGIERRSAIRTGLENRLKELGARLAGRRVLCAVSGGMDSAVAAALVSRVTKNFVCVFIENGLLRAGEADEVRATYRALGMELVTVNAASRFLGALAGVEDPEEKRRAIGEQFARSYAQAAEDLGCDVLVQGTVYSDVVESGEGGSAVIKTHQVVRTLPSDGPLKELVEPLRDLFKDEVCTLGRELGLPDSVLLRRPFPGPGLAIRIMGAVTREKLETVRHADAILQEEMARAGLGNTVWQSFAVLTSCRTVGVQGDFRTYENVFAIRAVTSEDAMTADWARIPYDVLARISGRIVCEVKGTNRVVYDITSKPPATIEWE